MSGLDTSWSQTMGIGLWCQLLERVGIFYSPSRSSLAGTVCSQTSYWWVTCMSEVSVRLCTGMSEVSVRLCTGSWSMVVVTVCVWCQLLVEDKCLYLPQTHCV